MGDHKQLLHRQAIASDQLIHDGLSLASGQLVGGAIGAARRLCRVGMPFDTDPLPGELSLQCTGYLIQYHSPSRIQLSRPRRKELIRSNSHANQIPIWYHFRSADLQGSSRIGHRVVGC